MTYRVGRHVFLGVRASVALLLVATPLVAGGCSSTSSSQAAAVPAGGRGAQDTGTYPNLNIAPQVAAPQFTEEQKASKLAQLHTAQKRQGGPGSAAAASESDMTTLARQHGADTLKAIEGKCDPIDPACN
ncbi:MAG: hypothetical protein ABS59_01015 [Methylobacterium sp. SCN 67-24]|nr:MAG: hypothetical protein ABS59_01015 [Methylobacterium sp. SCN 67-24]